MLIKSPTPNTVFQINGDATWPSIPFVTDGTGPHTWSWTIAWGGYTKSGTGASLGNLWDAQQAITNFGGTLTVRVQAGKAIAGVSVKVTGQQPTGAVVKQYLAGSSGSDGFDKLMEHESPGFKHFNSRGEPIKSFDGGYGMCQLTTPKPTFEQVWNWQLNVDGGLALFATKRTSAVSYLTQSGRKYTDDQLKYEAVCRWNGGAYHTWDAKAGTWVRPAHILCDSRTGNIGWDLNDENNKGKTEAELRKRDKDSYSHAPGADDHWKYLGVCYADAILG